MPLLIASTSILRYSEPTLEVGLNSHYVNPIKQFKRFNVTYQKASKAAELQLAGTSPLSHPPH